MRWHVGLLYLIPSLLTGMGILQGLVGHPLYNYTLPVASVSWLATVPISLWLRRRSTQKSPNPDTNYVRWNVWLPIYIPIEIATWTMLIWMAFNIGKMMGALGI